MTALKIPGAKRFADKCNKVYIRLRKVYLTTPEAPTFVVYHIRKELSLDEQTMLKILAVLSGANVCTPPEGEKVYKLIVHQFVKHHADLWSYFEFLLIQPAQTVLHSRLTLALPNVTSPFLHAEPALAVCPDALDIANRAAARIMMEPAGALTLARSLVETAIKWIRADLGLEPWPKDDGGTSKPLKECFKLVLGTDFDKPGIQVVVMQMVSAVNGLDEARNKMAESHGPAPGSPRATPRIARLAVAMATSVTEFLLDTYTSRQRP